MLTSVVNIINLNNKMAKAKHGKGKTLTKSLKQNGLKQQSW